MTLQDYVNDESRYFTSNTTFLFLEDKHYLNTSLDLDHVTNISFLGLGTGETEILVSPSSSISFSYSNTVNFHSLKITNSGQESGVFNNPLSFNYSHSIQINNVKFIQIIYGRGRSRALQFSFSSATIQNCSFSDGFTTNGGAIWAYYSDLTFLGLMSFDNNTADYSGGGIYANNSTLTFNGVISFTSNRAGNFYHPSDYDIGGGAIFAWTSSMNLNGNIKFVDNGPIDSFNHVLIGGAILAAQESTLSITGNSIFRNNSGYTGGGVFLVNSTCFLSGQAEFLQNNATIRSGGAIFLFKSALYINSSAAFVGNHAVERGGGIFLESSVLRSEKELNFVDNSVEVHGGGAMFLSYSSIEISGVVNFAKNKGRYGGALELEYTSLMMFESPLTVNFLNNEAERGGAIEFVDSSTIYATQCQNISIERIICMFEVQTHSNFIADIQLNFTENYANFSGASIYGGALDFCRVQVNGIQTTMSGYELLKNVSVFNHRANESSYISSKPLKLCSCMGGKAKCSATDIFLSLDVVPGRTFNISVITVGQRNMPSPSYVVHIYSVTDGSEIRSQSYNDNRTKECHNIGYQLFTSNKLKNMTIYPRGCNSYNGSLIVALNVQACPPGFELTENTCGCEERLTNLTSDDQLCNIEIGLIKRPGNAWLKPVYKNETYMGFWWGPKCQTSYCKEEDPNNPIWLNFSSSFVDQQCRENRTGILCGACKENHSLILNTLKCDICDNRYISLLAFFIFAGFGLIAVSFLLEMTIAKGTVNGLILYCNVVNICGDIFFPLDKATVTPLSIFIAWMNLDFGFPACFYDGLNTYSYAWLQFAFPFYLWFLIGLIIMGSKVSSRVGRLFGSNPVAVLATIILMSYTKLLQTSERVLSFDMLEEPDGTQVRVWRMDPNVTFFKGKHVVLAAFALFVIIFLLVPYILLLLFGYQLQKYSGNRGFRWFNNLKPFLDAYYAPFNKNGRYWTGFLLFLRSSLFLSFTITVLNNTNATLITAASLFTAVATVAWLSSRIYEKFYLEALEASFILNICILAIASYHIRLVGGNQLTVTYISVGIAFTEFVGLIFFHIFLRVRKKKNFKKIRSNVILCADKLFPLLKVKKRFNKEKREMVPIDTTVVAIREPLLEDATL